MEILVALSQRIFSLAAWLPKSSSWPFYISRFTFHGTRNTQYASHPAFFPNLSLKIPLQPLFFRLSSQYGLAAVGIAFDHWHCCNVIRGQPASAPKIRFRARYPLRLRRKFLHTPSQFDCFSCPQGFPSRNSY